MIIKALIITLLIAVMGLILIQHRINLALRIIMSLAVLVGIYLTLAPESANLVANSVGVGRGADLLLYLWVLLSLFALFALYVAINQKTRQITELTRAVAIIEAELRSEREK